MLAPRDAATVMVVRDGRSSLEVLLLRRRLRSEFAKGAYVFPGGAVDAADADPQLLARCAGRTDRDASPALGLDRGGLAFWVAAVRECFEEAGLLLAYDRGGDLVRLDDPAVADRFVSHRAGLCLGTATFADICERENLRPAVDRMHPFARWITPEGPPRRYDTRFFVARAPEYQESLHDALETVADEWVRPADALDRHRKGDLDLMFPTLRTLEEVAEFATAADVIDAYTSSDAASVAHG